MVQLEIPLNKPHKLTNCHKVFNFLMSHKGYYYTSWEIVNCLESKDIMSDESAARYCRTLRKQGSIVSRERIDTTRKGKPYTEHSYI